MTVGRTDLQVLQRKRRVNWDLYLVVGILKLALVGGNTGDDIYIYIYEGWNFNSGNYLFTTDTK